MVDVLGHRGASRQIFNAPGTGVFSGSSSQSDGQPWTYSDWVLVGDVTLFDVSKLETRLHEINVDFNSQDRVHTLLAAWAEIGPPALACANGDFAVAFIDLADTTIHLARDRAGSRPLYYAFVDGSWIFASEYKAIIASTDIDREIDRDSLALLQNRKIVAPDKTLMKNVYQVPPQSVVSLHRNGSMAVTTYWEPPGIIENIDFETHTRRISEAFLNAVERRLGNAFRPGMSISGGIDSIAMLAAARKLMPDAAIKTYTIGDAVDDPEIVVAERVAETFKTDHSTIVFSTNRLAERMKSLVWILEDPIARTETLMTYDLCNVASDRVDVMFRGDGADGLFGGMARHKILALAQRLPPLSRQLLDVYEYTQAGTAPENLLSKALIKSYFRSKIPPPPRVVGSDLEDSPVSIGDDRVEVLNRVLWKGSTSALAMLLQKVERPHSAFNMQTVSPFLDIDLVDRAQAVPSLYKNDGRRNKIVFRRAVTEILPEEFVRLPKYAQRVRETQEFCVELAQIVVNDDIVGSLVDRQLFEKEELISITKLPRSARWAPEHAMRVWTLILTEYWCRQFLDRDLRIAG